MIKKIALLGLGLISTLPFSAQAYPYKGESHYRINAPYKGEVLLKTTTHYQSIPCRTYTFDSGFYLGLFPGLVTSYVVGGGSVYKGFTGSIFAGYAYVSSYFYLAAELAAQRDVELQNYPTAINANGNPVGLRTNYGGSFSLIPGYLLADTVMGYLRIGTVTTHFMDTAQTKTGAQAGIGLQVATSENWMVRCEYAYAFYPSISYVGSPRRDSYHIGFIYRI